MLTAKTEEQDILQGFDEGTDAYVTKPFSPKVLVAKTNALLNRVDNKLNANDNIFSKDGFIINFNSGEVTVDNSKIVLTHKEYDLLKFLIQNEGINSKSTAFEKIQLSSLEDFEKQNLINFVIFDKDLNNVKITRNTKSKFDPYYVDYIKNKIINYKFSIHYFPDVGNEMPLFRIYNKYKIPTKYIVFEKVYMSSKTDYVYVTAIIPEVFTSTYSNILKKYAICICLFLIILIFIVSIILAYGVAKPILKINKTAAKIASLNFSEKCEIKNENEIGSLAKTINIMSYNLENTLHKLSNANEKLQKDLDLQRELDLLRKEFLGAVTHEFKTPITLIRGYTESIKDDVAQGKERELAFKTILDETERMDKLVKDLLELSTLESVGYKLNVCEFYINNLINKISVKYENIARERNITLEFSNYSDVLVIGDEFRISQLLLNFINNAIDNTPEKGYIKLSLENMITYVKISIENSGKNINEAEISRIWETFYRVEKSRNKKFGGTGLGLAISKAILELHNSDYGATNTPNGVCFFFTLKIIN
nr:ATP-binding protein [Clostridium muellerianum]